MGKKGRGNVEGVLYYVAAYAIGMLEVGGIVGSLVAGFSSDFIVSKVREPIRVKRFFLFISRCLVWEFLLDYLSFAYLS